jgi:hypothetical protein
MQGAEVGGLHHERLIQGEATTRRSFGGGKYKAYASGRIPRVFVLPSRHMDMAEAAIHGDIERDVMAGILAGRIAVNSVTAERLSRLTNPTGGISCQKPRRGLLRTMGLSPSR